ncbi:glycosyltransferase [Shewanella sp. 125m-7]
MNKSSEPYVFLMQNFYGGGAEKVITNLANELVVRGERVFIIVNNSDGPYKNILDKNVELLALNNKKMLFSLFSIIALLRNIRPKVLMSTLDMPNIICGLLALLSKLGIAPKLKYVAREANTINGFNQTHNSFMFIKILLRRFLYRFCDKVIANSPDTAKDISMSLNVPSCKISIIGNPVVSFKKQVMPQEPKVFDGNIIRLISVGRLEKQKNISFLIDVISILNEGFKVSLDVYGTGSELEKLKEYARDKDVEELVNFMGFACNLDSLYGKYHCFVLSSFWEGFGNVYIEALSAGIPIVTTSSKGGANYIFSDKEIASVCAFDPLIFSEKVIAQIKYNNLDLCQRRIERSNDFSIEKIADRYIEALNE